MRTYKLFIQEYNIMENDYITREEIVKTNDIYHEIGKIYCQSLVKIKRIDYLEITKDLEQEIERLNNQLEDLEKLNNANYQSFIETNKIIIELEKWLRNEYSKYNGAIRIANVLDKILELKGEGSNGN